MACHCSKSRSWPSIRYYPSQNRHVLAGFAHRLPGRQDEALVVRADGVPDVGLDLCLERRERERRSLHRATEEHPFTVNRGPLRMTGLTPQAFGSARPGNG